MDQAAVCCYRHPDRETGVRCARCDRPICPECMVSASVGFHCPSCVRGEHGEQRQAPPPAPRTVTGGVVSRNPRLVTIVLIAVNVAVYVLQQADRSLTDQFNLWGPAVGSGGQYYRVLTAMFLHLSIPHIALNMLSLWWIGPAVEAALGRSRYLTLYLLSGLGGSALSLLLAPSNEASAGASGAIFGLLGALFVLVRRVGGDPRQIIIVIALNLVFSFSVSGIDWRAHVGGLVTGAVIALGMVYAPRRRRALVQWGTCGAMFAAILGVIAVAASQYAG